MALLLNILVVHVMGAEFSNVRKTRKTSLDHILCFQAHAPHHHYYYHDIREPVGEALRDIRFHAVLFETTALGMRWRRPRDRFQEAKDRLSFMADWDAVKIAFPQDDYDHSELLDDWLADYRFDVVYSVLSQHHAVLYPRMSAAGTVVPALTGYVNDADIRKVGAFAKPFDARRIDIGYRAKFLPANFGSFGQVKGLLAERMQRAVKGRGLVVDISTDPKDVFIGDGWLQFLGDSRFCLGSEGGSSLLDPRGEIMDRVVDFRARQPGATYAEIEAECFPGEDRKFLFSAVSPRLFEAAIARCGQILIEAPYLDVLEPWVHYLPLDEHCEQAPEVLDRMRDHAAMKGMIEACYEALIDSSRFRYSTHVDEVLGRIADLVAEKHVQGTPVKEFDRLTALQREYSSAERRRARHPISRIRRKVGKLTRRFGIGRESGGSPQ